MKEDLLCQSCRDGEQGKAEELILAGSDINHCDGLPLVTAAQNGRSNIVKLLLDRGVNFSYTATALSWAARKGHLDCVSLLVAHGVDIHADNDYSIRLAKNSNHKEVVSLLENQSKVQEAAFELSRIALKILPDSKNKNNFDRLPREVKSHVLNYLAGGLLDEQINTIVKYASSGIDFYTKETFLKKVLYASGPPDLELKERKLLR
jgi:ankyrin repeat protein